MNQRTLRWVVPASCLVAAACGSQTETIDRRVEDRVTIEQGIYGQITSVDDVGEHEPQYFSGFGVFVYAVPPGTELGEPVANTSSEASRGFYEVALPASDHVVCTTFRRCVVVTITEGQRLRLDYEFGPGPGWSSGTSWPP